MQGQSGLALPAQLDHQIANLGAIGDGRQLGRLGLPLLGLQLGDQGFHFIGGFTQQIGIVDRPIAAQQITRRPFHGLRIVQLAGVGHGLSIDLRQIRLQLGSLLAEGESLIKTLVVGHRLGRTQVPLSALRLKVQQG